MSAENFTFEEVKVDDFDFELQPEQLEPGQPETDRQQFEKPEEQYQNAPISSKETAKAGGKSIALMLNLGTSFLASIYSGQPRENYKLSKTEQGELAEAWANYLETIGGQIPPGWTVGITTLMLCGSVLIKAHQDRKKTKAEEAAAAAAAAAEEDRREQEAAARKKQAEVLELKRGKAQEIAAAAAAPNFELKKMYPASTAEQPTPKADQLPEVRHNRRNFTTNEEGYYLRTTNNKTSLSPRAYSKDPNPKASPLFINLYKKVYDEELKKTGKAAQAEKAANKACRAEADKLK